MRKDEQMLRCRLAVIILLIISWLTVAKAGETNTVNQTHQKDVKSSMHYGRYEKVLARQGFDSSDDGLQRALASPLSMIRISAIQVIKNKGARNLIPELEHQLDYEKAIVRVEAGIALMTFSNPLGQSALAKEVDRGSELVKIIRDGKEVGLRKAEVIDYVHAAGALADAGESKGFELVKSVLLEPPFVLFRHGAAREIVKFKHFKEQGSSVLPLLLRATDLAIKYVDEESAKGKGRVDAAIGVFDGVARSLALVGGPEAIAKLEVAANHPNARVAFYAKMYLQKVRDSHSYQKAVPPASHSVP